MKHVFKTECPCGEKIEIKMLSGSQDEFIVETMLYYSSIMESYICNKCYQRNIFKEVNNASMDIRRESK